jgi:hypothetical protein
MEERRPHHTYKIQRRLSDTPAKNRCWPADFGKKMIRAAHAKEKQLPEKSRNRPNRLNLLDSTACSSARSNFFTKNPCLVRFPVFQKLKRSDRRDPGLKIGRRVARSFTEDLPAQGSKLGLRRRAPPEEAT